MERVDPTERKCPRCGLWYHISCFYEVDVSCEDCGYHVGFICPGCREFIDTVYDTIEER